MTIGDRIKRLRTGAQINQIELAKCAGCSRSAITCWENNEKLPGSKYLMSLANCLNTSVDYLLAGKVVPVPPQLKLDDGIDMIVFSDVYKLFEGAVIAAETDYSSEIQSQCLIKMYIAAVKGDSPAAAMLKFLTSL